MADGTWGPARQGCGAQIQWPAGLVALQTGCGPRSRGDEAYRAASNAGGPHCPVCQGAATAPVNVIVNVSGPDPSLSDINHGTHKGDVQHVHHDTCENHAHHAHRGSIGSAEARVTRLRTCSTANTSRTVQVSR